jgi:hypothetical protein
MANGYTDPSVELAPGVAWLGTWSATGVSRTGPQAALVLSAAATQFAPKVEQTLTQRVQVQAGIPYTPKAWVYISGAGSVTSLQVQANDVEHQFGNYLTDQVHQNDVGVVDAYAPVVFSPFTPILSGEVNMVHKLLAPASGTAAWALDDLELEFADQGELVARSNVETFLDNLVTVIEGIDPNIGQVFKAERRWSAEQHLVDDGATFALDPGGLLEPAPFVPGNATRFWILEPWVEPRHYTNESVEYRCVVTAWGFYGWKQEESQAQALRAAAFEIVDKLTLKTTELSDLAANMGSGYIGFCEEPPRMTGPPRSAFLQGTGEQGHLAPLRIVYFEEVPRS